MWSIAKEGIVRFGAGAFFKTGRTYRTRKMSNERKIKLPHVILTNCDGAELFFGVTGA
jgi:hypothetical protein